MTSHKTIASRISMFSCRMHDITKQYNRNSFFLLAVLICLTEFSCEKKEEVVPEGPLPSSFRTGGYPVLEAEVDNASNTYTLIVPSDTDVTNLELKLEGMSTDPDISEARDYTNPVSFKLKGTSKSFTVKVIKLQVGSKNRCLLTRIESTANPDDYFTLEYDTLGRISKIRTSYLFSDYGVTEFRYLGPTRLVSVCKQSRNHNYPDNPADSTVCFYNGDGTLNSMLVEDWYEVVDLLKTNRVKVNNRNELIGIPGSMEMTIDQSGLMTQIKFLESTSGWVTFQFEYDGKRHFMAGSRPFGIFNYFMLELGSQRKSPTLPDRPRLDLSLFTATYRQNISTYIFDGTKSPIKYTYNRNDYPTTCDLQGLRFIYSNCD